MLWLKCSGIATCGLESYYSDRLLESKYRIDLFCGLFMEGTNEGLQISPETLHALGERGISLGLDMYGSNS
jgi:hypothetical protein